MHTVYLLLGANLGDRGRQLQFSQEAIAQQLGRIETASAVYETTAWGVVGQLPYLNQVLKVITALDPFEILRLTQNIERDLGRVRISKWEARTIDIDLLFYDEEIVHTDQLSIPHPLLHQRRFTLEPLNELASDFIHPVLQKPIHRLLAELKDDGKVLKVKTDYL